MSTVPKALSPALTDFCRGISSERPLFIRSKPSADARVSACFDNVQRKIDRAGGQIAYGWAIWHVPGLYFEAEHHGVWRNQQGKLLDVSPQFGSVMKILFLPDPEAIYDPQRFRPNILKEAESTPLAIEFAALANARYDLVNSYRKAEHSVAMLSTLDSSTISIIDRRMSEILKTAGVQL